MNADDGIGQGVEGIVDNPRLVNSQLRLAGRMIRERWDVPVEARRVMGSYLSSLVADTSMDPNVPPGGKPRSKVSLRTKQRAVHLLLMIDRLNLDWCKLDEGMLDPQAAAPVVNVQGDVNIQQNNTAVPAPPAGDVPLTLEQRREALLRIFGRYGGVPGSNGNGVPEGR